MIELQEIAIDEYTRRNIIVALLFQPLTQRDLKANPMKVMLQAYELMQEIENEIINGA